MASCNIAWKKSAEFDLGKLDKKFILRIIEKVASLADNPLPPASKKLRGSKSIYRLRVGDYRVVYQVIKPDRQVIVYYVRHRKEVYKKGRKFKE